MILLAELGRDEAWYCSEIVFFFVFAAVVFDRQPNFMVWWRGRWECREAKDDPSAGSYGVLGQPSFLDQWTRFIFCGNLNQAHSADTPTLTPHKQSQLPQALPEVGIRIGIFNLRFRGCIPKLLKIEILKQVFVYGL